MTFNQEVKSEVISGMNRLPDCCRTAALSALIKGAGSPGYSDGFTVDFRSNTPALADFALSLLLPEWDTSVLYRKEGCFRLGNARVMLTRCGIISFENGLELVEGVPECFLRKECCSKSYLKGIYLACGSVTAPIQKDMCESVKGKYHFELSLPSVETALDVINLLSDFDFEARLSCRGEKQLVYLKRSEDISDLLAFFGAQRAVLELQSSIVIRTQRAEANRSMNCIAANISRAAQSGVRQAEAVRKLEKAGLTDSLSDELKETALLRKMYPEANLSELANLHKSAVSKSGLNHRLRLLEKMAEEIK